MTDFSESNITVMTQYATATAGSTVINVRHVTLSCTFCQSVHVGYQRCRQICEWSPTKASSFYCLPVR